MTKSRGIRRKRLSRLAPEELALFRQDPQREKKLGIRGYVVCRECGARRRWLDTLHFRQPGHEVTTLDEYRQKWEKEGIEPPCYATGWRKEATRRSEQWQKNNPAKRREIADRYIATHQEQLQQKKKVREEKRRAKRLANLIDARKEERTYRQQWRKKHGEEVRAKERAYHAKRGKASEVEVDAFLKDPRECAYVVCLEDQQGKLCATKGRDIGTSHLAKIHGIAPEEYLKRHPGHPTKAQKRDRGSPADWNRKSARWRIIGTELLSQQGYMSNRELAARLDKAGVKCPYGPTWVGSVNLRTFLVLMSAVRKWVHRPGKEGGPTRVNSKTAR
jgi:hypothetical protein